MDVVKEDSRVICVTKEDIENRVKQREIKKNTKYMIKNVFSPQSTVMCI